MTLVYSATEPKTYDVSGQELRIHWNIQEIQIESIDGENTETQYKANEALCSIFDSRSMIIEKIIGSVHTPGSEVALINNKETDPDAYQEYQEFRVLAKQLADNWINQK